MTLYEMLETALDHDGDGWSMGSFGVIAEFHHVAGDPAPKRGPGSVITTRGGLRLHDLSDVAPVAWEALSPRPDRWQQGVSLCLPEAAAAMSRRTVLTEIGPDTDALLHEDRGAMLFDMGLGQPQVDFCVRTADPALIAALRAECGRSVMDPASRAMSLILPAHPHRVALTRIGRLEVFQKIGGPDTGGVSPVGPHTHVLPKLLRTGRTHSANTPIPPGLVPMAGYHPESPVMDSLGRDRPFDRAAHQRFQTLLAAWGDPAANVLKRSVLEAVAGNRGPETIGSLPSRHLRAVLRVTLRQMERTGQTSAALAAWRQCHDVMSAEADDDLPGH